MEPRKITIKLKATSANKQSFSFKVLFDEHLYFGFGINTKYRCFMNKHLKNTHILISDTTFCFDGTQKYLGIGGDCIINKMKLKIKQKENTWDYLYGAFIYNKELVDTKYYIDNKKYTYEQFCEYFEPGSFYKYKLLLNTMVLKGLI